MLLIPCCKQCAESRNVTVFMDCVKIISGTSMVWKCAKCNHVFTEQDDTNND